METAAFDELRGSFRGALLPTSPDYDAARRIWNGAIDRRPACIARCTGVSDVVAAVRVARDHDLEIAVRGGGHNVAGTAVCDDGIVIDLSVMRAVWVDPAGRRARVQVRPRQRVSPQQEHRTLDGHPTPRAWISSRIIDLAAAEAERRPSESRR
jgi:hypothetical protein